MPPRAPLLLVGHRHQDGEVGVGGAADPDLAAVDHPVVAVAFTARGHHAGGIAAGAGLGDADRRDGLAARHRARDTSRAAGR